MKKIFLTFSVFLTLLNINTVSAEPSCAIEYQPSEQLRQYIENNRKVIKNITKEISASNQQSEINKTWNDSKNTVRVFNNLISWNSYQTYFNYYLIYPLSNDIPYEIKRDYRLLENESKGLNKYLETVIKRGYSNTPLKDTCAGINENCKLSGAASDVIGELLKNNYQVLDFYRRTVMSQTWYTGDFNGNFILVDDTKFKADIEKNYGDPKNNCTEGEKGFLQRIKEGIAKTKESFSRSKSGIKQWKDAWALATGVNTDEEKKLEKNLLAQELARQGASTSVANATLANLEKYSNEGYSLKNNFLTNTAIATWDSLKRAGKDFNDNVLGGQGFDYFSNQAKEKTEEEKIAIQDILSKEENDSISAEIQDRIATLYYEHIPLTQANEKDTEKLRTRIIKVHESISQSIKILDETIEIAEDVCNSQSTGEGMCTTK